MTALRKVGVAAGVPNSGTGTVSSLDTLTAVLKASVTQLIRPANTTTYAANDSISNNAIAGSVTPLVAAVSDTADDPVGLEALLVKSSDTGLGGTVLRAFIFNSDPTLSSGVQAGDNAPWSNKQAGFIGTMTGRMFTMNDGAAGRLTPEDGSIIKAFPGAGTQNFWVQYQTVDGFSPSAVSSTIDATFIATQGRA